MAWREGRDERSPAGEGRPPLEVVEDDSLHWGRGALMAVIMIGSLIIAVMLAVLIITGTDWGRERVRRVAVDFINSRIHGHATIGRISGNLLVGMTVHDFAITDSAGEPFVAVESFRGDYKIMSLLRKHIWIDNAVAIRPLVVLDRPPDGEWNWKRIFPRDTTPKPPSQQTGWGDWLRFTNATVVNGQLIVRSPWHPSEGLKTKVARDSAIRDVLSGGSRLLVKSVPGGFQKTVQLDSVTASLPLLRLSQPGFKDRLLEVSSLTMKAFPFRPPAANVRDLKGLFPFNNDSVWWKGAYAALPASKASGDGAYDFATGDLRLTIHGGPASFADMRWVYPRLPDGGGKFDLALLWKGALQDYTFTNANVRMGAARLEGGIGIRLGDTLTIHNTNVRFSGLDTRTLEQLVPHLKIPRRGTLSGHTSAAGGRHALALNGDVTFDDRSAGRSRATVVGQVGFPDNGGLRATHLKLGLMPLQVAMIHTWFPKLPIGGVLTGRATIDGSTNTQLAMILDIAHDDGGARSAVTGTAKVRLAGGRYFDVNVFAHPVSLAEVGRFFPAAGLHNSARGPIRLTGSLGDLRVNTDLTLPDGGRFTTRGALDLASADKGYDLTATLYTLNLRTITTKAPITSLSAVAMAKGRGTSLDRMNSAFAADLSTSRWDSIAVDSVSLRATLANGMATIPKLYAHGAHAEANVSGTFGLLRGQIGQLQYTLATDSLGAFNRWIPKTPGATTPVAPRPGVIAAAFRRARADSARRDKATEMQRLINGTPPPKLVVVAPKSVPSDTISGAVTAAGTLRGNIYDFDLRGRAAGQNVVFRGNFVKAFRSEYALTGVRTPKPTYIVGVDADSLSAMGFAFDSLNVRLSYAKPGGHAELVVHQDDNREYSAKGDYALYPDRKELRVANATFRFDTAYWATPHESTIQWGGPGVRVTNFELRNRGNGRIYANGLLPTSGVADFRLDVDNFPVSNIFDIAQTDVDATGIITLHGTMAGTLSRPAFRGAYSLALATYNGTPVPNTRGTFGYADQVLTTHAEALQSNGTPLATVDGRIPINLAFTGVTGSRLLPEAMAVDVVADSLPVELIPQFTDVVSNVHGRAFGTLSLRGTLKRPSLVGAASIRNATFKLNATGATFDSVNGAVRMANDTVYVDSLVGWAKGPVRVRGTLAVGTWREPSMNLFLVSQGAELFDNRELAKIRLDAGLALTGPFKDAYLSGAITATQGVVYAPEPNGRHVVGAGDPALFNVLDTAITADRDLFPPVSPLLANLRADVSIAVHHNVWVRNREANVEIYTDDPLSIHMEDQALSITGIVSTDRGEYDFLAKRFQIKRGSAMFIGSSEINPTLQITGEYAVTVATRGALNIKVNIGGTLKKPTLSLESDAQPPKTQSELLSLLAFGQSTTSLLGTNASSIAGSAATLDLFGVGAQAAVRRLAATALGVAVQQVQVQAGRGLGLDVFDITPGDVPQATGQSIGNFFTQTKFEAGKYINPRTFVSAQEQASVFGVGIDHRTQDGWRFNASFEPRIVLREPTLKDVPTRTVKTLGAFVLREWRF